MDTTLAGAESSSRCRSLEQDIRFLRERIGAKSITENVSALKLACGNEKGSARFRRVLAGARPGSRSPGSARALAGVLAGALAGKSFSSGDAALSESRRGRRRRHAGRVRYPDSALRPHRILSRNFRTNASTASGVFPTFRGEGNARSPADSSLDSQAAPLLAASSRWQVDGQAFVSENGQNIQFSPKHIKGLDETMPPS